jgi:hypothetical protein
MKLYNAHCPVWLTVALIAVVAILLYFVVNSAAANSAAANATAIEGLTSTTSLVYLPDPSQKEPKMEFTLSELYEETVQLLVFLLIDKDKDKEKKMDEDPETSLSAPTYSKSPNDLPMQVAYNNVADKFPKYIDKKYGHFFSVADLAKKYPSASTDSSIPMDKQESAIRQNIRDDLLPLLKWEDSLMEKVIRCTSMTAANKGSDSDTTNSTPITSYFGKLIFLNRSSQESLDKIKASFTSFMRPISLTNSVTEEYVARKNPAMNDDYLFLLATMRDILKKTEETENDKALRFARETNILYVFDSEISKPSANDHLKITLEKLTVFYYVGIAYRLYEIPGRPDDSTWMGGLAQLLQAKKSGKSKYVFLSNYPPINKDADVDKVAA